MGALFEKGGQQVLWWKLRQLTSSDSETYRAARDWLSTAKPRRAIRPLIKLLTHPASQMRTRAARTLGMIGDPRAIEPREVLFLFAGGEFVGLNRNRWSASRSEYCILHLEDGRKIACEPVEMELVWPGHRYQKAPAKTRTFNHSIKKEIRRCLLKKT